MIKKLKITSSVVIYQAKNGAILLRGDFSHETVWATQAQIADIFGIDRTVVTKHMGNILKSKEVDEESNVQKLHIANSDKPVGLYSLDIILAVGYRTNSAQAIVFRQWATKTLRSYILDGYVVNKSRIAKNYKQFSATVEEKAAHLLYFMVKNHPFTDGNKRSGAFAFVWFLKQANMLNTNTLTPSALTALTVLVAESNPADKDKIIKLILNLLSGA